MPVKKERANRGGGNETRVRCLHRRAPGRDRLKKEGRRAQQGSEDSQGKEKGRIDQKYWSELTQMGGCRERNPTTSKGKKAELKTSKDALISQEQVRPSSSSGGTRLSCAARKDGREDKLPAEGNKRNSTAQDGERGNGATSRRTVTAASTRGAGRKGRSKQNTRIKLGTGPVSAPDVKGLLGCDRCPRAPRGGKYDRTDLQKGMTNTAWKQRAFHDSRGRSTGYRDIS